MRALTRASTFLIVTAAMLATACGSVSLVYPDQSSVEFQTVDLTVGAGPVAATGNTVTGTLSVWLYSDTAADFKGQNLATAQSFSFVIGSGQVIPGFDQAVSGMAVGGSRRAIIPPSLAYGSQGSPDGSVPPNAALVVEMTLTAIK